MVEGASAFVIAAGLLGIAALLGLGYGVFKLVFRYTINHEAFWAEIEKSLRASQPGKAKALCARAPYALYSHAIRAALEATPNERADVFKAMRLETRSRCYRALGVLSLGGCLALFSLALYVHERYFAGFKGVAHFITEVAEAILADPTHLLSLPALAFYGTSMLTLWALVAFLVIRRYSEGLEARLSPLLFKISGSKRIERVRRSTGLDFEPAPEPTTGPLADPTPPTAAPRRVEPRRKTMLNDSTRAYTDNKEPPRVRRGREITSDTEAAERASEAAERASDPAPLSRPSTAHQEPPRGPRDGASDRDDEPGPDYNAFWHHVVDAINARKLSEANARQRLSAAQALQDALAEGRAGAGPYQFRFGSGAEYLDATLTFTDKVSFRIRFLMSRTTAEKKAGDTDGVKKRCDTLLKNKEHIKARLRATWANDASHRKPGHTRQVTFGARKGGSAYVELSATEAPGSVLLSDDPASTANRLTPLLLAFYYEFKSWSVAFHKRGYYPEWLAEAPEHLLAAAWRLKERIPATLVLKKGSKGEVTASVVRLLQELGYYKDVTSDEMVQATYGPKCRSAIKALQRDAGLSVDGQCGPETFRVLCRQARLNQHASESAESLPATHSTETSALLAPPLTKSALVDALGGPALQAAGLVADYAVGKYKENRSLTGAAQERTAPKIFISYRRADTASEADRLFEKLCDAYESSAVFYDKESIGPGEDYEKHMLDAAENTHVMLVMVGHEWQIERLHKPDDAIVKELEAAFKGGAQVLPVLVGGAVMPELSVLPKGLAWFQKRNAVKLGSGADFRRDFPDLLKTIRALIEKGRLKDAGTSDVHIETYRDLFRQSLLDDGLIDAEERETLQDFAAEHELSFSDVRAIEREVRAELDSQS